jgi:hypothetical protein
VVVVTAGTSFLPESSAVRVYCCAYADQIPFKILKPVTVKAATATATISNFFRAFIGIYSKIYFAFAINLEIIYVIVC